MTWQSLLIVGLLIYGVAATFLAVFVFLAFRDVLLDLEQLKASSDWYQSQMAQDSSDELTP